MDLVSKLFSHCTVKKTSGWGGGGGSFLSHHMKSVKSTLHRGGEGQNARRAQFSNSYGQGCNLMAVIATTSLL